MFSTAQELHIGIDQGLQSIDSNRKGSIEPAEKDWVLNTVMIQEINNRLNAASNPKRQGFEDTFKRIDDLQSLKVNTSEISNQPIYKYTDKAVYVPLPPDYHRLIDCSARVNHFGTIGSPTVVMYDFVTTNVDQYKTMYSIVKLPDATTNYADFLITLYNDISGSYGSEVYFPTTIFDINAEERYFSYTGNPLNVYFEHGYTSIYGTFSDYKYQFIRLVMDAVNYSTTRTRQGISVYWEKYNKVYAKDSFIFVMDMPLATMNIGNADFPARFYLSPTGQEPNTAGDEDTYGSVANYGVAKFEDSATRDLTVYTAEQRAAYEAATFEDQPVRVVKSSERSRLNKHYYGKTNPESPIGVIENDRFVVYSDDKFEFDRLDIEYYRKPRLISLVNNQGCEITSDSFKMELVEKTVQKLSARLQDPNYRNVVQENVILE